MTHVAIVLGAAVRPDGSASPALRRRAELAARLFVQGKVDMIIASGGVPQAGICEADLIAEICEKAGVPRSVITKERASGNTLENIINSKALLPAQARITLVSDRYHRLRAGLIAREAGLRVDHRSPPLDGASPSRLAHGYLREGAALMLYAFKRTKRIIARQSL